MTGGAGVTMQIYFGEQKHTHNINFDCIYPKTSSSQTEIHPTGSTLIPTDLHWLLKKK